MIPPVRRPALRIVFDYTEILPELLIGSRPEPGADAAMLRSSLAVSAVLSLQSDADLAQQSMPWEDQVANYRQAGILAERWPIVDFDAADLRRHLPMAAAALQRLVRMPHRVYVHCTLGLNRAPTVAIAWLAWHRGEPLAQAWQRVTRARDCAPDFEALWTLNREHQAGDGP